MNEKSPTDVEASTGQDIRTSASTALVPASSQYDNIPAELRAIPQWVGCMIVQREGDKPTKRPVQVNGQAASVTNPDHYSTFNSVIAASLIPAFCFTDSDCYAGIDLDKGTDDQYARQLKIYNEFNSYTELSHSGSGAHIIVKAKLTGAGRRREAVELYDKDRCFIFTGNVINNVGIAERQELTTLLHEQMGGPSAANDYLGSWKTVDNSVIIDRATKAKNGSRFLELWNGEYTCGDKSADDLALCNMLAYYTDCVSQVEELYCEAPLSLREKPPYKHRRLRRDYVANTVRKAFDQHIKPVDTSFLKWPVFGSPVTPVALVSNAQRYKLLGSTEMSQLPSVEWRIRSVFPARGLAAVYGPSGSGKTFLAFDMAAYIAIGGQWFNYKIVPTVVVYVGLEGEGGFKARVAAWEQSRGFKLPDNFRIVLQPFKLTNQQDMADLSAAVNELGSNAVVFIDTLNRSAPEADENSSKDMGQILEGAKRLQASINGLVVLIHHTGKDETKGMRGHSSLYAALDGAVEVSRQGDNRWWHIAKSKDGRDGDKHSFQLDVVSLGLDDGEPVTSCSISPGQPVPKITAAQARKAPNGDNVVLAWDAVQPLLEAAIRVPGDLMGLGGSISLADAVAATQPRLIDVEDKRKPERARAAVLKLVTQGYLKLNGERLWAM